MANDEQPINEEQAQTPQQESMENKQASFPTSLTTNILARLGLGNAYVSAGASIEELITILQHSTVWEERAAAARKLAMRGEQRAIAPLEAALHDTHEAVRAAAARSSGELEEYARPEPLIALLADEHERVVIAAQWALKQFDPQIVKSALVAALDTSNETIRIAIVRTLGGMGEDAPVAALEAILDDPSEQVCKEAIHALGTIWQDTIASVASSASSIRIQVMDTAIPHTARPLQGRTRKNGNVEFEALEPADLARTDAVPIVTQAFDNQWVPRTLLNSMLKGKISYAEAEKYLDGLVRTEYIRALINGQQLIVNRAFLYNNPLLFKDYLPDSPNRTAFEALLTNGVIVPFLLTEQSPDEKPIYHLVDTGFPTWQKLCGQVKMQCMRLSWSDGDQQEAFNKLSSRFHDFALTLYNKDWQKLMQDFGLDSQDIASRVQLIRRLAEVGDIAKNYSLEKLLAGAGNAAVTRNILYQQFVTGGESPALRHYDGTKPFAGEIKQMLDLAYNAYLADALGGHLLTPIDSPNRLFLQEWSGSDKNKPHLAATELVTMLRRSAFSILSEGMYVKSMGLLTLQDVQEIRKTDEWRHYITSLQALLKAPLSFDTLANAVYRNYALLLARITQLLDRRNLQQGGALTAFWEPSVHSIVTVGNASLSVIWNKDGAFYHVDEEALHAQTLAAGATSFSVSLIIGDRSSSTSRARNRAQLVSSIDVMKGIMPDARNQWQEIIRRFKEELEFQEYSPQKETVTAPTINEQEQPVTP